MKRMSPLSFPTILRSRTLFTIRASQSSLTVSSIKSARVSVTMANSSGRKTIKDIRAFKGRPEAFVCLTAYTAPMAQIADQHADVLLVGDSLGMVIYGFESTLPVTVDMM